MAVKLGVVTGVCSRCSRLLVRNRPEAEAVCDCFDYCPRDHGSGAYATKMDAYTPDLTPATYGPMKVVSGDVRGDLDHPMNILRRCPVCGYLSAQKPVEVRLS